MSGRGSVRATRSAAQAHDRLVAMKGMTAALAAIALGCGAKPPPAAPKQDDRVAALEKELAETKEKLKLEHDAAEALRTSDADRAAAEKALQDKLAEAVGKNGEVTTADGAVKLELVDQILFATGEADLTESGREVLSKVGAALKDVDKQIWVQGHTDDQPIFNPPPPKRPPLKKGEKPPPPPPPPKFATNWELSAYRALSVVHYLQDVGKIDPTRLAALAFGQYHPLRGASKAANRRIEIVLYPKPKLK